MVDVDLSLEEKRVRIQIEHVPGTPVCCPECTGQRPLQDHAPQRQWRHLDTIQFETILTARIPCTECPDCGVKTIVEFRRSGTPSPGLRPARFRSNTAIFNSGKSGLTFVGLPAQFSDGGISWIKR